MHFRCSFQIMGKIFNNFDFFFKFSLKNEGVFCSFQSEGVTNLIKIQYRGRRSFPYVTHNNSVCEYGSHPFVPAWSSFTRCYNWSLSPPNICDLLWRLVLCFARAGHIWSCYLYLLCVSFGSSCPDDFKQDLRFLRNTDL